MRMLALAGSDMGLHHVTPADAVGLSTAERTLWTSSSTTQCRMSVGVTNSLLVLVTAGQRSGSLSQLVSYDNPKIRDAVDWLRNNLPTTGSISLSITGVSIGEKDKTGAVRVSGSAGESTRWVSDSSIHSMAVAGAFNHTVVRVTVDQRLDGSLTGTVSYDCPLDTDVEPAHQPSTGRSTVVVTGFNLASFDTTTQVRMGGSGCESTRWISATTLLCRLASGAGSAHSMVVTVFKQSSPFSYDDVDIRLNPVAPFQFCYEAPRINNTLTKSGFGGYGSTRGGWLLTIQGTGFGMFADVARVVVESNLWTYNPGEGGVDATKLVPGRVECKIARASLCVGCGDSSMFNSRTRTRQDFHPEELDQVVCIMPAGDGHELAAVMAVADQQGEHQNLFSYRGPS